MFFVNNLRRARVCFISKVVSQTRIVASPSGYTPMFCFGGLTGNQLHAVRRTQLHLKPKVQPHAPSTSCLSTTSRSDDGSLIYTGSLGRAVRGVKMFSYSTSGASLFLMPQILFKTGLGVQSLTVQLAFCGVIGFFTFLTPVLLHLITKGYVIRLYHNPDRDIYTAITYSVFLTEHRMVFHQNQVRIPNVSKMFTTFYANDTGLLVNPDLFPFPQDYNHLMGYDKPFTFSMEDTDRQ
ncbi:transmembrane protein 70, mitochondrial [Dunckerocampus dactyliophorus]|uniref:transmembrane protein 70, mitochondrial n=1 Tax=Dunckerocampus dactyliophorus TaxID=161453 RepID=UPI0024062EA2|nr:transmembrane protein 70, mitochondrial [Dunckerocampus dactyliophorus]